MVRHVGSPICIVYVDKAELIQGQGHRACASVRTFENCTFLWSPYVIGQTIYIFMLWFVLLSSFFFFFFPRLISAAEDWMSAILPHMVWP